jgi:hypothetical protein
MRMNELVNTRLFNLLAEPSQDVSNEQMSNAYGGFNPMIRTSHSIAVKYDGTAKALETAILSQVKENQEKYNTVLQKISDQFGKHAEVINNQGRQITALNQLQNKDNAKLLKLISLYSDLATCGVMDGKRKENLRAEINDLINEK